MNQINDGALEEDFESSGEVRPDVAPDLDVDVVAIDIDEDIDSADSRHNFALRCGLCREGEAQANVDSVHNDVGVTLGNKDPRVGAEVVRVEGGGEVIHGQSKRIICGIGGEAHIRGVLLHANVVVVQVVFAIVTGNVWQCQVVQSLHNLCRVDILCLFEHGYVERCVDSARIRCKGSRSESKESLESFADHKTNSYYLIIEFIIKDLLSTTKY